MSKAQSSTPKLITWRDYTHRRAFSALLCVSAYPPIGMNVFCYQTHTYTQASFVSLALWHSVVCVRFIHRRATSFSPALHVPCFFCVIHTHIQASYTHHSALLCSSTRSNYMHVREQVCARVRLMYVLEHTSCVCLSTHACNKMRNFFSFRRITEYLRSLGLLQTEMEKKYI